MANVDEILKTLTKELEKRLVKIPAVPPTFHPLTASNTRLRKYGYPSRPPASDKVALKIWKAIVSAPLPPAGWNNQIVPMIASVADSKPYYNEALAHGRQETSQNWSGVVTHCDPGDTFQTVFGMWTVPKVKAPSVAVDCTYSCSTWIGMDGYKPTSFSMPQIGTTQSVVVKSGVATPSYEAWFQWWTREGPTAPVIFQNLNVKWGDVIACSLEFVTKYEVSLMITNVGSGQPPVAQKLDAPAIVYTFPFPIIFYLGEASGTTAEWVAERPRSLVDDTILFPLPSFDTVPFILATVTNGAGTRDYPPARILRMVERFPDRLEVISRVDPIGSSSSAFTVGPGVERKMGG